MAHPQDTHTHRIREASRRRTLESCLFAEPNICCAERFPLDFYEHFDDFDFQKSIFTLAPHLLFRSLLDVQLTKINRISDFASSPAIRIRIPVSLAEILQSERKPLRENYSYAVRSAGNCDSPIYVPRLYRPVYFCTRPHNAPLLATATR